MDWNRKLKQLMGDATHLVRNGQLAQATRAIQQALRQPASPAHPAPTAPWPGTGADQPVAAPPAARFGTGAFRPGAGAAQVEDAVVIDRPAARQDAPARSATPAQAPDTFTRIAFTHPGAARNPHHYHLYVPPGASSGAPMPLVVMLHGCTQNPTDFATGTGMNDAAARANALVLYPEQPHSANAHGCWNWFRPEDQRRDRGEPALLMAMVQDVMARHPVDAARVYVGGLSAGGAMAALLAREYPDVFAAAGVHSGLSAGAAHNMMAALSAMKNGAKPNARGIPVAAPGQHVVPVIVFHGDADATVHARNGDQIVAAALGAVVGGPGAMDKTVEQGASPAGQPYTRTMYRKSPASERTAVAEHWVLHGGGHAWAGGSAQGSHTDPRGISATAEMLRFFLEHRRP
jgi:poly(hydroxyalkanoate) depolymerase family esterase